MDERVARLLTGLPSTLRGMRSELPALARFLGEGSRASLASRLALVGRYYRITVAVDCPHRQSEMLEVASAILSLERRDEGCVVEAGAFKGGSTAKLSLACARVGRRLYVYDSFSGLPENDEVMELSEVLGERASGRDRFAAGAYRGSLREVEENLRRWGDLSVCSLRPGLFRDTLPALDEPVALAFVDVDLAASTRDCLTHLWPRLVRSGSLFSHDGHLPLVRAVFEDRDLWARLGGPPSRIEGLGSRRLVRLVKGEA